MDKSIPEYQSLSPLQREMIDSLLRMEVIESQEHFVGCCIDAKTCSAIICRQTIAAMKD